MLLAASLLALSCGPITLRAQTTISTPDDNRQKSHLYSVLFRQALAYERLAGEAEAAGTPKPYFRRILAVRLNLSEVDAASLLRMAQGYQSEDALLRAAIAREKAAIRADFPLGFIPQGMNLRPSPALDDLQAQEGRLALRYRGLLHNAMGTESFELMEARLYASFSQGQTQP